MSSVANLFASNPFTVKQAAEAGISRGRVRDLVKKGRVRRVLRGVYVDASVPDTTVMRARALALVVPDGVVVCLRTAAWLWGVDVTAMGAHLAVAPVDLMGPAGSAASRRTGISGHTGQLGDDDVVFRDGVALTTPSRTAADLARLLRRPDALASLDAILRLPDLTADRVASELTRFAGYRGVVQGRELVALADPRSESPMESRTRLRALDAGFPVFEPQVEVFDDIGTFVARLDLGRREDRKAVEYDGDVAHASVQQQLYDRRRRRRVERCGWGLAVVTADLVLGRGLAFENGIAELLGCGYHLSRHHPRYGGWDRPGWAAA